MSHSQPTTIHQRENLFFSTAFRTERTADSITEQTQTPLSAFSFILDIKSNQLKMYNRVTLIGNLGRDPEIRRLENGTAVGKFTLATNEYYKDNNNELQQQTEWHDVVVWRYLAENAEKVLKKGATVFVEGKITHRKYQDQNGNDRYITEIVANQFKLLGTPQGGNREGYIPNQEPPMNNASREVVTSMPPTNNRPQNPPPAPQQQRAEPVFEIVPPPSEDSAPIASDDLPF